MKKDFNKRVSWVNPSNIHLTLKFLGEVDETRIDQIGEALEKAASGIRPFSLSTGKLGGFPNIANPRVLWLGLEGGEEAVELQKKIDETLAGLGFEKEKRAFHPHLTLARIRNPADGRALGALAIKLRHDINIEFTVDSFILFRSKLTPSGAEYSELRRFGLA
ncbi:MAG: RNA 2',3'-cyclic phosphodiesterase [Thermodesulfobacteriota bacterium]|nr:MAG: RNA 2',3'-cyclic phosphodiesterase [Thermodesulfobacteriota bacterium]